MSDTPAGSNFGSCCGEMKEAIGGDEFEPLIAVGEDDILYMSVGIMELEEDEEPGFVEHPVFFCPFCGTKVQTPEDVKKKTEAAGNA